MARTSASWAACAPVSMAGGPSTAGSPAACSAVIVPTVRSRSDADIDRVFPLY